MEAVPIFAARAVPFGTITADTYDTLLSQMMGSLRTAGHLDGVLVAPHGATVSEKFRDADGHWLAAVREYVGTDIPIIGTLDPHANLSRKMVDATNALVAYRTNPHLDQRTCGVEAATLMEQTLRGEIWPTQAAAFPPMAINIERQLTSEPHCRALYQRAESGLSNSILLGFPYADVEEMGSAILSVTDRSPDAAAERALEISRYLWHHREEFVGKLISIDEALNQAARLEGPICLLDMGDNAGGGSPADSTHLAHAIRQHGVRPAFVCLWDPAAVQLAERVGVAGRLRMQVGGKTDRLHGEPFEDDFTVFGLYDGKFTEPEPRHGGFTNCDQGPTAVLRGDSGLTVMVTTRRMPPFSLRQLTTFHVDPTSFHVIVAKGVNAPVAAYQPVCRHLIRVNTPGCTTADMTSLEFHHRRKPMFPFERDTVWA